MMQRRQIQIPIDLFRQLCRIHLLDDGDPDLEAAVRAGLEAKLDATVRREIYTASKTDPDPAAREAARQRYLDLIGMHTDHRW